MVVVVMVVVDVPAAGEGGVVVVERRVAGRRAGAAGRAPRRRPGQQRGPRRDGFEGRAQGGGADPGRAQRRPRRATGWRQRVRAEPVVTTRHARHGGLEVVVQRACGAKRTSVRESAIHKQRIPLNSKGLSFLEPT